MRFSTKHYRKKPPVLGPESGRGDTIPLPRGVDPSSAAMNATEAKYAAFLAGEVAGGRVAAWWYQRMSWRLGPGTHYRPDFVVPDGLLELHEVKARAKSGFGATEASWAKVKTAAGEAPFPIRVVWPNKGAWEHRAITPTAAERAA